MHSTIGGLVSVALLMVVSASPSYQTQAEDVAKMMESVRYQAERGGDSSSQIASAKKLTGSDVHMPTPELIPGLNADLMRKADEIEQDVRRLEPGATSASKKKKKTLLASQRQETQRERAARYFATHGMEDVGRLLGDQMTEMQERQAISEAADAHRKLEAGVHPAGNAQSIASPGVGLDGTARKLDMDLDDEDQSYKESWKAVDKLRLRAPHV